MRISDWSSDVCSSDLRRVSRLPSQGMNWLNKRIPLWQTESRLLSWAHSFQLAGPESRLSKPLSGRMTSHMGSGQPHCDSVFTPMITLLGRSEERRVGKECVSTCRSRWSPYH